MNATDTLEVLHLARIRGLAPAADLGDVTDLVEASLLLCTERGCMLTADGLRRHEELLAGWRETADLEALATAYERFLAVNQSVKAACSAWQTSARDEEALFLVVDDLSQIVERVRPALDRAAALVERFDRYGARLDGALGKAGEGDARFVTSPEVDCVHGIWFECHEDFLTTLGRSREEEGSY